MFNGLKLIVQVCIDTAYAVIDRHEWPEVLPSDVPDGATCLPAEKFHVCELVGQKCRLAQHIVTVGGSTFPCGAIFRCVDADELRQTVTLQTDAGRGVRLVDVPRHALEVILLAQTAGV